MLRVQGFRALGFGALDQDCDLGLKFQELGFAFNILFRASRAWGHNSIMQMVWIRVPGALIGACTIPKEFYGKSYPKG